MAKYLAFLKNRDFEGKVIHRTNEINDVKWDGEYERLSNGSVTLKNVTLTVNKNLEELTNGTVTIKHLGYYLDDGKWVSEIEKTKGAKEDNMIIYSVYQFIHKN